MRCKEYKNGWSAMMDKFASPSGYYVAIVRNARGDVHDKILTDSHRAACEYYRAFNAIAKNA
jgi:hypothetical protein